MKRIVIVAVAICVSVLSLCAQTKVSVLGDSYSTFRDFVSPSRNAIWYTGQDAGDKTDVKQVSQTWLSLLLDRTGWTLEKNNSYSGSTVCNRGYNGDDSTFSSFLTRMLDLGSPEVIIVFGGTNDSWAGSPIGEYQYSKWTKADLYNFRPAFSFMLSSLKTFYPDALIVNVTNSALSEDVTKSMDVICHRYKVKNVQLHDVEKKSGHPSVNGMKAICDQICSALGK